MAESLLAPIQTARRTPVAQGRTGRAVLFLALGAMSILVAGLAGYLHARQAGATDPGTAAPISASVPEGAPLQTPQPPRQADSRPGPTAQAATASGTARLATALQAVPAASEAALHWPLWEFQLRQPIPPRDPPLTPPPWRLIGASSAGGVWKLIILREGKAAPEFHGTGDHLPGGYIVGQITDEDVTLIQGKRALLLSYIGTR